MGGVGFQQAFILVFSFFAVKFHRTILQLARQGVEDISRAMPLLYAVYAVLLLITVRLSICICIYSTLIFYEDENHLPTVRICPRTAEQYTEP
jgi:hypothetical protein